MQKNLNIKAVTKTDTVVCFPESRGRCEPDKLIPISHHFRAEGPKAERQVDTFRDCCVNA